MPRANRFKPGQPQHAFGVDRRKPVLRQHRGREPQRLGNRRGQLPQAAVEVDNQARGRVTSRCTCLRTISTSQMSFTRSERMITSNSSFRPERS